MPNIPIAEANKRIDEAFKPLGLEGSRYFFNGRQYHGSYEGRGLHIYTKEVRTSPNGGRSVYMGHNLEFYLDSPLKTRAALSHAASVTSFINRQFVGLTDVPVEDFASNKFVFKALEPAWANQLVHEAKDLMLLIAKQDKQTGFNSLQIYPEAACLRLRLHWEVITAERVETWLTQLAAFVSIAQSLPAPMQPVEESKSERGLRLEQNKAVRQGLVIAVAFIIFMIGLGMLPLFMN